MAAPTLPTSSPTLSVTAGHDTRATSTTPEAPCSTPASHAPAKTSPPPFLPHTPPQSSLVVSLASIIAGGGGTEGPSQDPGSPPATTPVDSHATHSLPAIVPVVGVPPGISSALAASSVPDSDPSGVISAMSAISIESGGNIVLGGHTLNSHSVQTIGSGSEATTVSIATDDGSTYMILGTSATFLIPPTTHGPLARPTHGINPVISEIGPGTFVVDGQTLALHSPITVTENGSPVTVRILTSNGETYIALGTTTTIPFGDASVPTSVAVSPSGTVENHAAVTHMASSTSTSAGTLRRHPGSFFVFIAVLAVMSLIT